MTIRYAFFTKMALVVLSVLIQVSPIAYYAQVENPHIDIAGLVDECTTGETSRLYQLTIQSTDYKNGKNKNVSIEEMQELARDICRFEVSVDYAKFYQLIILAILIFYTFPSIVCLIKICNVKIVNTGGDSIKSDHIALRIIFILVACAFANAIGLILIWKYGINQLWV